MGGNGDWRGDQEWGSGVGVGQGCLGFTTGRLWRGRARALSAQASIGLAVHVLTFHWLQGEFLAASAAGNKASSRAEKKKKKKKIVDSDRDVEIEY